MGVEVFAYEPAGENRPSADACEPAGENTSVYAWGRTAWRMTREELNALLDKQRIVRAVDLCSSFPVLPQIIRENFRTKCVADAKRAVGQFSNFLNIDRPEERKRLYPGWPDPNLTPEEWKVLKAEVIPRASDGRKLLEAIAIDAMYPEPPIGGEGKTPETEEDDYLQLIREIRERMGKQMKYYVRATEREGLIHQGRFHTWIHKPGKRTFSECLSGIQSENLDLLLDNITQILSSELAGVKRHLSVYSLDIEDPSHLTERDVLTMTFPSDYMDTEFFIRAMDNMKRFHVQADVKLLPFLSGSISLFTCFEGWPYYFGTDIGGQLDVAKQIDRTLAPGGVGIFFPWTIKDEENTGNAAAISTLGKIEEYFLKNNFSVEIEEVDKEALMANMGLREKDLTKISEIFQRNNVCRILRIKKPQAAVE